MAAFVSFSSQMIQFIWNNPWNHWISLNAFLCFVNASSARPYCFRLSQERAAENASSFLPCEHVGPRFAYLKWQLSACNFKTFIISCIWFFRLKLCVFSYKESSNKSIMTEQSRGISECPLSPQWGTKFNSCRKRNGCWNSYCGVIKLGG